MIFSKKYLKRGCLPNMLSQYLRRCFAYSCRWKFRLRGCNQSASPLENNDGNVISNNPTVLYSLIRDEPMPGQLSTLVNSSFVLLSSGFGLFAHALIISISHGALGSLDAKEVVCKPSNMSSTPGIPSNIVNYVSSSISGRLTELSICEISVAFSGNSSTTSKSTQTSR